MENGGGGGGGKGGQNQGVWSAALRAAYRRWLQLNRGISKEVRREEGREGGDVRGGEGGGVLHTSSKPSVPNPADIGITPALHPSFPPSLPPSLPS